MEYDHNEQQESESVGLGSLDGGPLVALQMVFVVVGNHPVVQMDVPVGVAEMSAVAVGTGHVKVTVDHSHVVDPVTEYDHSIVGSLY